MTSTVGLHQIMTPPEGDLPPERERAIRRLLESAAEDSRHRRVRLPGWSPRFSPRQLRRTVLASVTAIGLVGASLVVASTLLPATETAEAATPVLAGHETADGEPAAPALVELAGEAASSSPVPAEMAISTERWSLAVTVGSPDTGEGAAPLEGRAPAASLSSPSEGASDEGAADQADETPVSVTSAVIPVLRDLTRHEDGSVSVREIGGSPQFPGHEYERAWNGEGRPGPAGQVVRDERLPASSWNDVYPAELPVAPAQIKDVLAASRPAAADDPGELIQAVHDLRREQVPSPEAQAGILEMLAAEPGIETLGATTDRLDRDVMAVAAETDLSGWPVRHILLLDPADGGIAGYEQVLMGAVDTVDLDAPAIIDYTMFR